MPSSPTIAVAARAVGKDFDPWPHVRALPSRWRPILLDSGGAVERARWSIWAARPTRVHAVSAAELGALSREARLARLFGPLEAPETSWRIESEVDLFEMPFVGGWIGRVDYEAGVLCAARAIEERAPRSRGCISSFAFYPRGFAHDRLHRRVLRFEIRGFEATRAVSSARRRRSHPFAASTEELRFPERVESARELIAAGDLYQVNLSAELERRAGIDARRLYGLLRQISPAPYGAFACDPESALLCNSPELHFRTRGAEWHAQPIKGTRARRPDEPEADRLARDDLWASEKDRAELAMIVDLYRNDLGRLAVPGSVCVPAGIELRSFANVHHLMADVRARSARVLAPQLAFAALFPAGSITGAPKQRAMEVVRDLEERERGIYCGAVGAVDVRGEMMFNVAIRSAEVVHGELALRMGAGIVADSDPGSELEEIRAKCSSWREALARCEAGRTAAVRRSAT